MYENERAALEQLAKSVKRLADAINIAAAEAATSLIRNIDWGTLYRGQRKYERRVAYHKRLSDRNRMHPKKRPRR